MSTVVILCYLGITNVSEVDNEQPQSTDATTIELNTAAKELTTTVVIAGNILIPPNPLADYDLASIKISKTVVDIDTILNNNDLVTVDVAHVYYNNDKYAIVNKLNIYKNNYTINISTDGKAVGAVETNVITGYDVLTRPLGQLVGTIDRFEYYSD